MVDIEAFFADGLDPFARPAVADVPCLVAVDVEVARRKGFAQLAEDIFQEFAGSWVGRRNHRFRVAQLPITLVGEDLLEVSETLEVADQIDAVCRGIAADFAHLIQREMSVFGGEIGMAFDADDVFDVEHHGVVFQFRQITDLSFDLFHRRYGTAADVVHEYAQRKVAPVGDDQIVCVFAPKQMFERLQRMASARFGRSDDVCRVARDGQPVEFFVECVTRDFRRMALQKTAGSTLGAGQFHNERSVRYRVGKCFEFLDYSAIWCRIVGAFEPYRMEAAGSVFVGFDDFFGAGRTGTAARTADTMRSETSRSSRWRRRRMALLFEKFVSLA